jgi:hypothetical protein
MLGEAGMAHVDPLTTLNFINDDVAQQRLILRTLARAVQLLDGLTTQPAISPSDRTLVEVRRLMASAVSDLEVNSERTLNRSNAFVHHMIRLMA